MINQIIDFIIIHWVEWLFLAITGVVGQGYRVILKKQKDSDKKNKAICEGVQAILRERIIDRYNHYSEKGYCPIYAKESLERLYGAYSNLGGNDVASELYEKVINMRTERND